MQKHVYIVHGYDASDVPREAEAYVHRIGRTGRAGRHGEVVTFLTPKEKRKLRPLPLFLLWQALGGSHRRAGLLFWKSPEPGTASPGFGCCVRTGPGYAALPRSRRTIANAPARRCPVQAAEDSPLSSALPASGSSSSST